MTERSWFLAKAAGLRLAVLMAAVFWVAVVVAAADEHRHGGPSHDTQPCDAWLAALSGDD